MNRDEGGRRRLLTAHIRQLLACRRCPHIHKPLVSGGPVLSKVILVGQAPGDKEARLGHPFAWTAGKTMFQWFEETGGLTEERFRASIYMAAVCRCFPGKKLAGGDRVPSREEVFNCSDWFERELDILQPELIIPVGKLGISRFLALERLNEMVGRQFQVSYVGRIVDVIPLPHPSGASPWHRVEPGKTLLKRALALIGRHPTFVSTLDHVTNDR